MSEKSKWNGTAFWALALVVGASAYRILSATELTALPNFSPVMAMAFCAGWALPGVLAFVAPIGCLFVSDLLLNAHYGQPLWDSSLPGMYGCYLFAIFLGRWLRGSGWLPVLGATLADSVLFYLVTNSLAWWKNEHYTQTLSGWAQALTMGRPGFAPTWTFFRNSLVSDLLFTAIFLTGFYLLKKRGHAAPARAYARS